MGAMLRQLIVHLHRIYVLRTFNVYGCARPHSHHYALLYQTLRVLCCFLILVTNLTQYCVSFNDSQMVNLAL